MTDVRSACTDRFPLVFSSVMDQDISSFLTRLTNPFRQTDGRAVSVAVALSQI